MNSKFEREMGLRPPCAEKVKILTDVGSIVFFCIFPLGHTGPHGCVGWTEDDKPIYFCWRILGEEEADNGTGRV